MTIITKPLSEKKDKLEVPLVEEVQSPKESAQVAADAESQSGPEPYTLLLLRARARRVSTTTTLLLLFTSMIVVGIGIVGGTYLYQEYLRSERHFRGWCNIPYTDRSEAAMFIGSDSDLDSDSLRDQTSNNMLMEQFELDLENQDYEKIDVPDFRDGRSGRFIHDFNTNITGIIDITGKRCFIMPLNRHNVLPPRSLLDLIQKIWDGYYKVDTEVVRENMRVITPPIDQDEMKNVGTYINKECSGVPVYRLEKYIEGVVKRSAVLDSDAKFAQFSGTGIIELDIVNFDDVKRYEGRE